MSKREMTAWAWAVAGGVLATYWSLIGTATFMPIYLSEFYIDALGFLVVLRRTIQLGERLDRVAYLVCYALAVGISIAVARHAPQIGEPNYCVAWRFNLPPHRFRCTAGPIFAAMLAASFWLLTAAAVRLDSE